MRYNNITEYEVCNGSGGGVSLFVQGCDFHCKNCFNSETWDFDGGTEWTKDTENKFLELISKPFIKRVSILGGEPLHQNNMKAVESLIAKIRARYPTKTIWIYSGFTFEELNNLNTSGSCINTIFHNIDVLVDGRFVDSLKDLSLAFRGSSNQRIIDVKKTLATGSIVTLNY